MKALTKEWIQKAEADLISAGREYRARKRPNYDAACFFAQQCAEKYLKARLVEDALAFPRTHDLEVLLDLVMRGDPEWDVFRSALSELTSFAIIFRYPGESATREMARSAFNNALRFRAFARTRFQL